MADRFYGYQYDTTPRKLNPDYAPYRKRYSQKDEPVTTSRDRSKNKKKNTVGAEKTESKKTNKVQSRVQKKEVPEYRRKQVKKNREKVSVTNSSKQVKPKKSVQNYAQSNGKTIKVNIKTKVR